VIAAALLLFDGRLDLDRADARSLLATAFCGIVDIGIAYALWFAIVRRLSAATASLDALGFPVIGVLATVLMVREGADRDRPHRFWTDPRRVSLCDLGAGGSRVQGQAHYALILSANSAMRATMVFFGSASASITVKWLPGNSA